MPRRGRPPGAKTAKAPIHLVETPRCKCGSTERSDYFGKTEQEFSGTDEAGQPYTHIIRRRTRCLTCGQVRVDRSYENRVAGENPSAGNSESEFPKSKAD